MIAAASVIAAATAFVPGATFKECEACPEMIVVPAGTYIMGAAEITVAEFAHFVAATGHDAGDACNLLAKGEWQLVGGRSWRDPGYPQGEDHPVACVSWNDAMTYAAWISIQAGTAYRLLSEAEWEYVARTGGAAMNANHSGGEWQFTAPVGSFGSDRLGLHDVRGNVWEWLADCYHDSYQNAPADGSARTADCSHPDRRALRGGSWNDGLELLRAGYRLRGPADGRYFTLGFRIARSLP